MRLEVEGQPTRVLEVTNGAVTIHDDDGKPVKAVMSSSSENEAYLERVIRGELNPVVAALQSRIEAKGDPPFIARVLFGLQAASSPTTPSAEV